MQLDYEFPSELRWYYGMCTGPWLGVIMLSTLSGLDSLGIMLYKLSTINIIYQSPDHIKLYTPCISVFPAEVAVFVAGRWLRTGTIAGNIEDTVLKKYEFYYANSLDNIVPPETGTDKSMT